MTSGFSFRSTYYSRKSDNVRDRLSVKYHGIRFIFHIMGHGGKFDIASFSSSLGSGIALTAISAFVTEFLLRHCIPEKSFYRKKRMEVIRIEEEEAWRTSRASSGERMDVYDKAKPISSVSLDQQRTNKLVSDFGVTRTFDKDGVVTVIL